MFNFLRIFLSLSSLISSSWEGADKEEINEKCLKLQLWRFTSKGTQLNTTREATWDVTMVSLTNWSGMKSLKGTLMPVFENRFKSHKCSIVLEELNSWILWSLDPLWSERFCFIMIVLRTYIFSTEARSQCYVLKQCQQEMAHAKSWGVTGTTMWHILSLILGGNFEKELSSESTFFLNNEDMHGKI